MSDSTLSSLDAEFYELWGSELERYRFVFLRYLEVAQNLLEMHDVSIPVNKLYRTWVKKQEIKTEEITEYRNAIRAEDFLYTRYELQSTPKDLERVNRQFRAESVVSNEEEAFLWDKLLSAVAKIDVEHEFGANRSIWFNSKSEIQRSLLLNFNDFLAHKRILYYKKRLGQFNRIPCLPNDLETGFLLGHRGFTSPRV